MKRKVVFVTGSMRRGGAERVISIIANELVKRNWEVHIVTLLFGLIGYKLNPDINVIDISIEKRNQVLDTPRLIRTMRRIVKDISPDAVVSFMLTINIVTWLATRFMRVKFIPSERNDPSTGRGKIKHWLSCRAYAASYKTVFQTERAKGFYSKKIQSNGIIIPNPIQVDNCCNVERKHKIVSVGRLEVQKNRRLLIESFSDIHRMHPEYSLHIYGEGSQEAELRHLIIDLDIGDCVILHGNVNDVQHQIADAEMFVLSSDYEGLSNALLEAMMMGLPCISTNCAGADEAIENEVNGLIIPTRDRQAMTEAIEKLISNKDMRIEFARKAIDHSRKFLVTNVVDQWEKLIQE